MSKEISVLTGGAGGFGFAAAVELGKTTSVLLGDFNEKGLKTTAERLQDLNIEVFTQVSDVRSRKDCDELAKFAASLGSVKNLIHIAGVCPDTSYAEAEISSPELTIETNCIGTINIYEAFLPVMSGGGAVVGFASQAMYFSPPTSEMVEVFRTFRDATFMDNILEFIRPMGKDDRMLSSMAYGVGKQFIKQYSDWNVKRFGAKGTRVITVSPGLTMTRQGRDVPEASKTRLFGALPLTGEDRAFGRAEDFGALIAFVCSSQGRYLNGMDLLLDGGLVAMMTKGRMQIE
jgi:NAD(P)-dependent dehydrogenase (short-subunit alcohol dehydrogenase family)